MCAVASEMLFEARAWNVDCKVIRYEEKNVLAHVHLFPGEKPKLNQGVKQMLLQGSLKRRCVPYLADRNRQAG